MMENNLCFVYNGARVVFCLRQTGCGCKNGYGVCLWNEGVEGEEKTEKMVC